MELLKAPTPSSLEVLVSHRNVPLTIEGKRRLCLRVDRGRPKAHIAAEAGISRQSLHKWHTRWQVAGEAGLHERSSRPHRSPRRTLTRPGSDGGPAHRISTVSRSSCWAA
ncbi:hypothetical protein GCM10009836_72610 [Pseudonocardia ailaonensis]|uniref:DNA-binding domain-containing protein n=1 Tax=Pseudonocardia ailaonensis TaxID=367279 RepID=A0ABN2NPX4_9PSEU